MGAKALSVRARGALRQFCHSGRRAAALDEDEGSGRPRVVPRDASAADVAMAEELLACAAGDGAAGDGDAVLDDESLTELGGPAWLRFAVAEV